MSFPVGHTFSDDSGSHLAQIINNLNAGIWEFNIKTGDLKWSDGFYTNLGYLPGEIKCSSQVFFKQLLYYKDKAAFLNALNNNLHDETQPVQIRILTKTKGYHWFDTTIKRTESKNGTIIFGAISNINNYKLAEFRSAQNELLYTEAGKIGKFGSWEVDVESMGLSLAKPMYEIFELPYDALITIDDAINYFEPAYRQAMEDAFNNAIELCLPYDIEALFRTAKNNVIWVKAKGIPITDDKGKCVTIRGILQDIDHTKRKTSELESSANLLTDQNRRLQNFAYIVSHNLRSHTGNLQFMVNLFEQSDATDDRAEIFSHIQSISNSLTTTIEHLNDIVKMHTEIANERSVVEFEPLFENIKLALKSNIEALHATVKCDFSECEQISYIPAYLESILQNLLTNALKYSEPARKPIIKCRTYQERNHVYLVFEDNGQGIDLGRYGDKIFGMYKTFHQNPDAKGLGLFMTRNQIEALGGAINVESAVDVGTKFTIRLV